MGVPAALERHFSRADPAVLATLRASLAVRYLAVSAGGLARRGKASRGGHGRTARHADLPMTCSFALGARVEPLVAGEIGNRPQHQAALRRGGEHQDAHVGADPHARAGPGGCQESRLRHPAPSERTTGMRRALLPTPSPGRLHGMLVSAANAGTDASARVRSGHAPGRCHSNSP